MLTCHRLAELLTSCGHCVYKLFSRTDVWLPVPWRQFSTLWPPPLWLKANFHLRFTFRLKPWLWKDQPVSDSSHCFIFQRSQWACFTEAEFQFILRSFCFFSLCDSRLGFSSASGFRTYSVLPNSFSPNIAQVLLQWQHINFFFFGLFVCLFLRKPNI